MTKTIATILVAAAASAHADPLPTPSTYTPSNEAEQAPAAPLAQPADPAAPLQVDDRSADAAFSGKRLALEIGGGELVSLLVSMVTYNGLCNGQDCLGSALAAYAVDFAVTPIAIWAGGRAMGGQGTLGMAYLGASTSLAAFSVPGAPDESPGDTLARVNLEMTISALLMPVTSALIYEVSSQVWFQKHNASLAVTPTGRSNGAIGGLTVRF